MIRVLGEAEPEEVPAEQHIGVSQTDLCRLLRGSFFCAKMEKRAKNRKILYETFGIHKRKAICNVHKKGA